jgi:hypothetical protein
LSLIVAVLELTVFAEQGNAVAVHRPYCILDRGRSDLGQDLLLLDIEQNNGCRRSQQMASCSTVEDVVGLHGALDGLCQRVVKISDLDGLRAGRTVSLRNEKVVVYGENVNLLARSCPERQIGSVRQRSPRRPVHVCLR